MGEANTLAYRDITTITSVKRLTVQAQKVDASTVTFVVDLML